MINQETMDYLLKRQIELIKDQTEFEEMLEPVNFVEQNVIFSREEIRRLITETQARRNELALLVTCNTIDEEHKAMTARDDDAWDTPLRGKPKVDALGQDRTMVSDYLKLGHKDMQAHPSFTPKK